MFSVGRRTCDVSGSRSQNSKTTHYSLAGLLAGSAVSFVGVIGFVDLIAPHIVRRYLGRLIAG